MGYSRYAAACVFADGTTAAEFFNRSKTGELMALVIGEVGAMHSTLVPFMATLIRAPIEIALLLGLLLTLSPMLTLIALSTSIGTLVVIRIARQYLRRYSQRMQHAAAQYTSTLQEGISSIRTVKAFNAEQQILSRFWEDVQRYVRSAIKLTAVNDMVPAISETLAIAALAVVLYVGGLEVFSGNMRGADLMTFLFALFAIMAPVASLTGIPGQIQRGLVAAERVFTVVDSAATVCDGSLACPPLRQAIRFDNVWYRYDSERYVLRGVSIEIPGANELPLLASAVVANPHWLICSFDFTSPAMGALATMVPIFGRSALIPIGGDLAWFRKMLFCSMIRLLPTLHWQIQGRAERKSNVQHALRTRTSSLWHYRRDTIRWWAIGVFDFREASANVLLLRGHCWLILTF